MSALVAGYGSSDDEDNFGRSTAAGPSGSHHTSNDAADDADEDDEALEAAARKDMFSLSTLEPKRNTLNGKRVATGVEVMAAPDVLAEVSLAGEKSPQLVWRGGIIEG
jgi:hypothetical protein